MGVKAAIGTLVLLVPILDAGCSSHAASSGDAATSGDGQAHDGGGGAGSSPDGALTVDADLSTARGFCLGFLELFAETFSTCDGLPLADTRQLFLTNPVSLLPCDRFESSIAAGRVAFDGTNAAACVALARSLLSCEGTSSMVKGTVCDNVLTPLVPLGGVCRSFYITTIGQECQSGAYCKEDPNLACTGVCTARAPVGAACELFADVRCVDGATCDSASKKCVTSPAALAEGERCGGAGQASCLRALYCDTTGIDAGPSIGVCHARRSSGPCVSDDECVQTERCIGKTAKVCAPTKGAGEPCTPGAHECGLIEHCGADGKCSNARAALGQPCGPIGDETISCVDAAYCDGGLSPGTCRAMSNAGDACTSASALQCAGNNAHCDMTSHQCVACAP